MNRILVPTDFSEQAENALKVAAMLARRYNADIYLLHMMEIPMQHIDPGAVRSDIPEALFFMKLAHKQFEELMESDFLEGITVHETVKADISFNEIKEACKEFDIDLIREHKNKIIKQLNSGIEQLAKQRKVEVICGSAKFISEFRDRSKAAIASSQQP